MTIVEPGGNRILAALPEEQRTVLLAHARPVEFAAGDTLIRPGEPISTVFFPDRGVISVVTVLASGQHAALAAIGREGITGCLGVLQIRQAPSFAWVLAQVDAAGHVVPIDVFVRLFHEQRAMRELVLAHIGRLVVDVARSAMCNRFHSHRERLARWLVEMSRKAGDAELPITHEGIAQLVGGPRHAATTALGELRSSGAIEYLRGRISVIDEARLLSFACECGLRE